MTIVADASIYCTTINAVITNMLTVSLLSGPDVAGPTTHFAAEIHEGDITPLKELEEVDEESSSLLAPEYDREELLERYHVSGHSTFLSKTIVTNSIQNSMVFL